MGQGLLDRLRDRKNLTILALSALVVLVLIWPPRLNRYQFVNGGATPGIYRVDRLTGEVYWIHGRISSKVAGLGEQSQIDFKSDSDANGLDLVPYSSADSRPDIFDEMAPERAPSTRASIFLGLSVAVIVLAGVLVIGQLRQKQAPTKGREASSRGSGTPVAAVVRTATMTPDPLTQPPAKSSVKLSADLKDLEDNPQVQEYVDREFYRLNPSAKKPN